MARQTTPTQMRLTAADLARIDAIRDHHGLTSRTEAVRLAVAEASRQIPAPAPAPAGKKPKKTAPAA